MKTNSAPLTGTAQVEIHSRIMKLQVILSQDKGSSTTSEDLIGAITGAASIKIEKQTPYGSETKIYEMDLLTLMEIAGSHEGAVRADIVGTKLVLRGTVELSLDGAEHLADNTFYVVKLVLPAGVSGDLFAIDSPFDAATQLNYESIRLFGNAPKDVIIDRAKLLAVPKSVLRTVELIYANGKQVKYAPEEIEQALSEINELSFIIDGKVIAGSYNYYVIPVSTVNYVRLDVSSDVNCFLVNESYL